MELYSESSSEDEEFLSSISTNFDKLQLDKGKSMKHGKRTQANLYKRSWSYDHNSTFDTLNKTFSYMMRKGNTITFTQASGQQFKIWDCSISLSRFLEKNKHIVQNKTVLELGCGIGLPGLTCAYLGTKKVILSDLPSAKQNIENIVKRNKLTNMVECLCFYWGTSIKRDMKEIDLVLLSDVVYGGDIENLDKLCISLVEISLVSNKDIIIVNCIEKRTGTIENLSLLHSNLKKNNFKVKKVLQEEFDKETYDENIEIFIYS
eukprot:maker-scaffold_4-snap-gene-12.7-mRNA-1 protein AED:0.00 eAED:0.00 QI:137/1/1/1/0/0/2/134/261